MVKTAAVVGGGISGILAALLLKKRFDKVVLVDREQELGGLMRSWRAENGAYYDYGTHFARDTGLAELDAILFDGVTEKDWFVTTMMKAGNYFGGELNDKSMFIKSTLLPKDVYERGICEFMHLAPDPGLHSLADYYEKNFGPTFTRHVFEPVIRKLFGRPLQELHADAHALFGLSRMAAFTPETSRELKKSPHYDRILSFHSYHEGISGLKNYYPRQGGIGRWARSLLERCAAEGVEVATGESVEEIRRGPHGGAQLRLSGGRNVAADKLVWTVAPALCLKAAGVPTPAKPPAMLGTTLFHYSFDKPYLTDLFYFVCYETKYRSYRVTLYNNVGEARKPGPYSATVEVVTHKDEDVTALTTTLPRELIAMGILPPGTKTLYGHAMELKACIPVLTNDFVRDAQLTLEAARREFPDAIFVGKGAGAQFFIHDVLKETYREVTKIL